MGVFQAAAAPITPTPTGGVFSAAAAAQGVRTAAPASSGGFVGNTIVKAFTSGINQVKQGVSTIFSGSATPVQGAEAGLGIEAGAVSALTSPLAPLFAPVSAAIGAAGKAIGSIPAVQTFAASPAGATSIRVATDVANAGTVAGTIAGSKAPEVAADLSTTAKGIKATSLPPQQFLDEITTAKPSVESSIVSSFNKAVKPTTAGKTGPGQLDAYNRSVVSAVKSISSNKNNLVFETDTGPTEVGRLPTTRGELADAVAQTKQDIFKQYDALATQATGQGVQVPLAKAGSALDDVINSQALQITNPRAVAYAKDMQARLQNKDGTYKAVTPEIAQQAITNFNAHLKAFYRNPTYDSASTAAIDAGIVSKLRETLDETINEATGANYQELKHQYGALASIEKDVNKAAIAQAKQTGTNASGLGKYVDVFAGGDMVEGLLSLHPTLFLKGVAQSGISHFFQWLNSPDRAVSTMFKKAIK